MNTYERAWPVQDGGNNLAHIVIFYLLLLMPLSKESPAGELQVLKNQIKAAFTNSCVFLIRAQIILMYF